jgi:hypothetical protein
MSGAAPWLRVWPSKSVALSPATGAPVLTVGELAISWKSPLPANSGSAV